ncbi:protein SCO1/2 [Metabacillus crassostreae]|uniref:SCO family protein n=1 Tax=Metabacillus crassostreae TaxID=929098 RepID=UPI00195BA06A|nr:SCO family protein [Metabacillus crassostreae]MBM7602846.1 protein SCO1/2 [Metabacillus crassostreae]
MKKTLLLLIFCCLLLSACNGNKEAAFQMEPFTYTDQNGQSFGSENLKGKVWIADFIFTNCDTVCPPMTASMAALQKELTNQNLDVELVSFSVDPTIDTPEVLKKFMDKFTTNSSNWHMLTGYKQAEIEAFAREEFQTLIQKPSSSDQVIHSTSFYLINQHGEVVNSFGFQQSHFGEMIAEIKKLK